MSYAAIVLGLIGSIYLLIVIADRMEYFYIETATSKIPAMKYFIWLVASWLSIGIYAVTIQVNELEGYGLGNTLGVIYKGALWTLIFITAMFLIGFIYFVLEKLLWTDSKKDGET